MFWSAVEAAAFVEKDPETLIRVGLSMIPLSSHVARSIREAAWCRENGLTWGEARERIATIFGSVRPCHAVPNHGFTIIGWLYGRDFGDRLCKAVNCGFDTDCTGATLGALLGILDGTADIPGRWGDPIGEGIVLHPFTGKFDSPATLADLTDRTVALAERAAAGKADVGFGDRPLRPEDLLTRLFRGDLAREALRQDIHAGVELLDGTEVRLHYGGEPVLRPGIGREVSVTVEGQARPYAELAVPDGWSCRRTGPARFMLHCAGPVPDRNTLTVTVGGRSVGFAMLGPGEARGVPAGQNVETCPRCHARVEACICGR